MNSYNIIKNYSILNENYIHLKKPNKVTIDVTKNVLLYLFFK